MYLDLDRIWRPPPIQSASVSKDYSTDAGELGE